MSKARENTAVGMIHDAGVESLRLVTRELVHASMPLSKTSVSVLGKADKNEMPGSIFQR